MYANFSSAAHHGNRATRSYTHYCSVTSGACILTMYLHQSEDKQYLHSSILKNSSCDVTKIKPKSKGCFLFCFSQQQPYAGVFVCGCASACSCV